MEFHLTATGRHLPYGITQCYLPPNTSECAPPSPQPVSRYSIYLPRRDGRLSWPRLPGNAPAGNRTHDLSITSPTPYHWNTVAAWVVKSFHCCITSHLTSWYIWFLERMSTGIEKKSLFCWNVAFILCFYVYLCFVPKWSSIPATTHYYPELYIPFTCYLPMLHAVNVLFINVISVLIFYIGMSEWTLGGMGD